MQPVAANRYVV